MGVNQDATEREIKIAYRSKAREAHPDRGGSGEWMQDVNAAYQTLMDPASRSLYDATYAEFLAEQSEDEMDLDQAIDLTLERIGSFDVSISETLRQKHAQLVAKYQQNPLSEVDEKALLSESAAISFLREQGDRYFESEWHPVENGTTFHPLDLFKLKMEKGIRAVPLRKGTLDEPLDVKKAFCMLMAFIECDYYGQNFHDVMAYLDREIQAKVNRGDEKASNDELNFFKAVQAILSMGMHPEERGALFEKLTVITDYAAAHAWPMMGLFSNLFQNKFFRNLYLIGLEQHWQEHGKAFFRDLEKFEADEQEYKAHANKAWERFRDNLTGDASQEHLEWLRHLRVSARVMYLYEKRGHTFSKGETPQEHHRERAFWTLDWLGAMVSTKDMVLVNMYLRAITRLSLASNGETRPEVVMANEALVTQLAREVIAFAHEKTIHVKLYVLMNIMPHFKARKYDHGDQAILKQIENWAFRECDFFPLYQAIRPNIHVYKNQETAIVPLRLMLHQFLLDVQINEQTKKEEDKLLLDHSLVRLFYEAYDASLKAWYEETYNPRRAKIFRSALMESILEQEGFDWFDIDHNLKPGAVFDNLDRWGNGWGWIKPLKRHFEADPYAEAKTDLDVWAIGRGLMEEIWKDSHPEGIPLKRTADEKKEMSDSDVPLLHRQDLEVYESLNGISVDRQTGQIHFAFKKAIRGTNKAVVTAAHLKEILSKRILDSYFSLDEADPKMRFHPFQKMRFPSWMKDTLFVHSMLMADLLLKFFTTGVEVQSEYPYDFRSTDELIRFLPPHLKKIIQDYQEASNQRYRDHTAHRFWITATHVPVVRMADEKNNTVQYAIGDIEIRVETHCLERGPDGELKDTEEDKDGFSFYVLSQEEILAVKQGLKRIEDPAILLSQSDDTLFLLDGGVLNLRPLGGDVSKQLLAQIKEEKRDEDQKIIKDKENGMLFYDLTREIASKAGIEHHLKPETIFVREFTKHYDEFSEYFAEFKCFKEQARMSVAVWVLLNELMNAQENVERFKKEIENYSSASPEMVAEKERIKHSISEPMVGIYKQILSGWVENKQERLKKLNELWRQCRGFNSATIRSQLRRMFREQLGSHVASGVTFEDAVYDFSLGRNFEKLAIFLADIQWDKDLSSFEELIRHNYRHVSDEQIRGILKGDPSLFAEQEAERIVSKQLQNIRAEIQLRINILEKLIAELRSLGIDLAPHEAQDLTNCCLYVPSAIHSMSKDGSWTGYVVYGGVDCAPRPRVYDVSAPQARHVVNPFSAGSGSFLQLSSRAIQAMKENRAAPAGVGAGAGAGGGGRGPGGGGDGGGDDEKESEKKNKKKTKEEVLAEEKLPQEGEVCFIPQRKWRATEPLNKIKHGDKKGYLDQFGNVWCHGPSRTPGESFEWDVQLSEREKIKYRNLRRGRNHLNVSWKGKITH